MFSLRGLSQLNVDSTINRHNANSALKLKFIEVTELPLNIVNNLRWELPELKIKAGSKLFFSYFSCDSSFFSIGRINYYNLNLNRTNVIQSGILKGEAILYYKIKFLKNHAILIISESSIFPISFE